MNLDFSSEQKALAEEVAKVLAREGDTAPARQCIDAAGPYSQRLWELAGELGWCGVAIPEEYGGLGMGYLELCLIAEQLGRVLAPVPFSSSICLAAEALLLAGTEEQKGRYLPGLASGEAIGTVCLGGDGQVEFAGGLLSGGKGPVVDGQNADFAVLLAETPKGQALVIADLAQSGIARSPNRDLDPTRPSCTLMFDGAKAEILVGPDQAGKLLDRLLDRAAVVLAFEQLGLADACLEMSTDYAKQRFAFGRPIGGFQAIKHKLADIYVANQLARSNAYYAAWALSADAPELALAAAAARVSAGEASQLAARETIQVHGGIGFTWEMDCHLYYRRAKHLDLRLGSSTAWKLKLAETVMAEGGE